MVLGLGLTVDGRPCQRRATGQRVNLPRLLECNSEPARYIKEQQAGDGDTSKSDQEKKREEKEPAEPTARRPREGSRTTVIHPLSGQAFPRRPGLMYALLNKGQRDLSLSLCVCVCLCLSLGFFGRGIEFVSKSG